MNKWNLIVDVPQCENCNNCVLAAKDELVGNTFPGYSAPHAAQGPGVLRIRRKVRGHAPMVDAAYLPVMCNHCDDAPCVKAGGGAVHKRDDGIVLIDPVKAKGRRDLVDTCPYGAIVWNEAEQVPQNWFFDAHLLDAGDKAPRCVGVCPTATFEAANTNDHHMEQRSRQEKLRTLHPEWGTKPRVYYRHLERFDYCFIGGSVSAAIQGKSECVEGAEVRMLRPDGTAQDALTDAFGDFKFDGLAPGSGIYTCVVSHPLFAPASASTTLEAESIYLGDIVLNTST